MTTELFKKYRPTTFAEVVGQTTAVEMLESMVARKKVPHAMLFTGGSGCGKTTLARVLARAIGCVGSDLDEKNSADVRGIDTIRAIGDRLGMSAFNGRCRVIILDEAHKMTNDAQTALLKILEEPPKHVYIFLCTTHPDALIPTIRSRCTPVEVSGLNDGNMDWLIRDVCTKENITISQAVISRIIDVAEGGARAALVMLEMVVGRDQAEALSLIELRDSKTEAFKIAQLLVKSSTKWPEMATLLAGLPKEADIEGLRYMVLAYCNTILTKGKVDPLVFRVMQVFSRNTYDTKKYGLTMACYAVIEGGK